MVASETKVTCKKCGQEWQAVSLPASCPNCSTVSDAPRVASAPKGTKKRKS